MITEKDLQIIGHLRKNARKKITHISKELEMPVTTIYDKLKAHEKKGIVKKHTTLLDFSKLGYQTSALIAMSVDRNKREKLQNYLITHPHVNSLYRVDFDHDFLAEVIFENLGRLQEFIDRIDVQFSLDQIKTFNILQELKKEEFLSN